MGTPADQTYAYRERRTKRLITRVLLAEAHRWRLRRAQLSAQEPSVAVRFEVEQIDEELAVIEQSLVWLADATKPRRVR